ncbi:hypothetical protein H8356DRAFT_1075482 [Neocallimastix lanati (nom. inval.)]|uniref:Uncharacterized protein n=1 Tax=Neocallimastix californiae TaxID=1754190 RepID=A0A1Y2BSX9_9FUNG|nr:hypothetical protein H8356DRAFT_1075482 [Neocallimastix sp. JGI-2020a]ORY37853.1 hypothetical protein LY90DRAFT_511082 [Neocallimastix californiae]|eukprot:ORY37853.1 hypothetical protein LY90DRAFT_511082 [Neocallimastix californiae]
MLLLNSVGNVQKEDLSDKLFKLYPSLLSYINGKKQSQSDYYKTMIDIRQNDIICVPYAGKVITLNNFIKTDSDIMKESFSQAFNSIIGLTAIATSDYSISIIKGVRDIYDFTDYIFNICISS